MSDINTQIPSVCSDKNAVSYLNSTMSMLACADMCTQVHIAVGEDIAEYRINLLFSGLM